MRTWEHGNQNVITIIIVHWIDSFPWVSGEILFRTRIENRLTKLGTLFIALLFGCWNNQWQLILTVDMINRQLNYNLSKFN